MGTGASSEGGGIPPGPHLSTLASQLRPPLPPTCPLFLTSAGPVSRTPCEGATSPAPSEAGPTCVGVFFSPPHGRTCPGLSGRPLRLPSGHVTAPPPAPSRASASAPMRSRKLTM
eukprot:586465-Hanusia_phi.AAC.1